MNAYEIIYEKLKEDLRLKMTSKRYTHTLGVVQVSEELASINNVDLYKVRLAAMAHDIAKEWSCEDVEKFCMENNLDFSYLEGFKNVLHSHLGAEVLKILYDVQDEDILNAVKYHTTGRENMSVLEKIIYLADFLDPNRNVENYRENFEKAKIYAYENLDKGMKFVLERTLVHLDNQEKEIYIDTKKAYEYYKAGCESNE